MDQYIHVKSLENYHPGYKDRELKWAKIYFKIVHGDPEFEMIENEIDKWRFVAFILLELQAQKPLPLKDSYFKRKGFNLKKRSMSLTIKMLQEFILIVTKDFKTCVLEEDKEKDKEEDNKDVTIKHKYGEYKNVLLTDKEYDRLKNELGLEKMESLIKWFSSYIKEKKYKSDEHNLSIRRWVIKAVEEKIDKGEIILPKKPKPTESPKWYWDKSKDWGKCECGGLFRDYETKKDPVQCKTICDKCGNSLGCTDKTKKEVVKVLNEWISKE